ncbi:hypothetical protein EJ03DRAFT_328620 [Teratosphaeria nubilosa]|uniref:HECT-type E3 ubiquitin transferase n=1 Tax=Teratosphaeria nubilosa TaxID=161662 RepID=A0A6G1L674_9PEZI|nr:hypothetical protein EJ03DRAFT_328620 [Teratosphaeria nubilosa]
MGRIKKVATERHTATQSPFVAGFVDKASLVPLQHLPQTLADFPQEWPFPRGDLYHWIPLLNRFDQILEVFNQEYSLNEGPQTQPFERRLLKRGIPEEGKQEANGASDEELENLQYGPEGDRELIQSIVSFERILLEHCGNRSLYASSGHINDLLNTTSLDLLRVCLKLGLRLAQRYQVARYKNNLPNTQAVLMANHYAFNLDNLHKLAMPFPKPALAASQVPVTPGKAKEKAAFTLAYNPTDLVTLVKEPESLTEKPELAAISITYYDQSTLATSRPATAQSSTEAAPSTPTPARRTSNLGPSRDRPSPGDRSTSANDVSTPSKPKDVDASASPQRTFHIPASKIGSTPAWQLVREALPHVPVELRYDLLHRVRIAECLKSPEEHSQTLVQVRLLAIANMCYAMSESKFQEKIGTPDNEEPRRFHIAQQLADLLQPSTNGQQHLSMAMETTVLIALEALLKARHKLNEVVDALSITVNHGVLYYQLRKVIATLHNDGRHDSNDSNERKLVELDWREATFDLVNSLQLHSTQTRSGERMVQAGILGILVEVLDIRSDRGRRYQEKVLSYLTSFIHNIPSAFQAFANSDGFKKIGHLIENEVRGPCAMAESGQGLPKEYRSKVVDYEIPFFSQSILRQLFKFTVHMFDHGSGNNDRLLRNLIDQAHVLESLKIVIENAKIFGSNVWGGAVNILSTFIHNEPTSYTTVGEAGIPKALLEAITGQQLPQEVPKESVPSEEDFPGDIEVDEKGEIKFPSVDGILPVGETVCDIPTAFGAICLNENGMALFQASKALIKYFDIFVSSAHVKVMDEEPNVANAVGNAFDELSRHHPRLKEQINSVVLSMVKRVASLCHKMADKGVGAKLYPLAGEREVYAYEDKVSEQGHAMPFMSACVKFLEGYFHNGTMCALFCESGGAEHVLKLATSPSNPYDLAAFQAYHKLSQVLKTMCEAKPHLVLPSIICRVQNALKVVKPIVDHDHSGSFLASFTKQGTGQPDQQTDYNAIFKSLAIVHTLSDILGKTLAPPTYSRSHSSQTNQLFHTLNFTDIYIQLVDDLSRLHAACIWENLALQTSLSQEVRDKSDPKPYIMRRVDSQGYIEPASQSSYAETLGAGNDKQAEKAQLMDEDYAIKNIKALRYVLDQTPKGIETFFHTLAQALTPKRSGDLASKQHATLVAQHIVQHFLTELDVAKPAGPEEDVVQLRFLSMSLQATCRLMLKTSFSMDGYGPKEALTIVLNKFYLEGGFKKLNELLERFGEIIAKKPPEEIERPARDGMHSILDFYALVVRSKTIIDAMQSNNIAVRDHKQADFFVPSQLVVEIRSEVLPAVRKLWESNAIETIGDVYAKKIIDILRIILKAEGEDRALKRADKASRRRATTRPEFRLRDRRLAENLQHEGVDSPLAREAVYRCNNDTTAREYARLRMAPHSAPRFAIPEDESSRERAEARQGSTTLERRPTSSSQSVEMTDGADNDGSNDDDDSMPGLVDPEDGDNDLMQEDEEDDRPAGLLHGLPIQGLPANIGDRDFVEMIGSHGRLGRLTEMLMGGGPPGSAGGQSAQPPAEDTKQPFVTVDDLGEQRKSLRENLINHCLDVLSAVPAVTFELSDLITAAVAKNSDRLAQRAEIGGTLVSSLLSLQGDERSKETSAKISASAHLLALVLQDKDFFESTIQELSETLGTFTAWVKLQPEQKVEDAPWLEMILLIIEKVLSEDEEPVHILWEPPPADDPTKAMPEPLASTQIVPAETRTELFEALIDMLPKIGKNSSLALSVSRVLVTLSRKRELARRLSEKQSMGRLFMMIRQLSGAVDEKLHGSFMLLLRHMVEDESIIRQYMKTEIKAAFESHRSSRGLDTTSYTRNLHHLVLREPALFVDVTKEMVEISRYDGSPTRAQVLALKKDKPAEAPTAVLESAPTTEDKQPESVQPSVEASEIAKTQTQGPEPRGPTIDTTDGVVAFLLRELSNYKDVEDRPAPALVSQSTQTETNGDARGDIDMADASASTTPTPAPATPTPAASPGPAANGPSEAAATKQRFKAEEHTIYIYRCFLLQCLSELLLSYSRTKIEFINFSRKPESTPATPSKPRAGTLNYLLNVLLPVGTLEHKDGVAHGKKQATSNWATAVLVALCTRTPEKGVRSSRYPVPEEDDPDLTFVRKFVLEHALRAFKEALASTEPLDQRYSRLLSLGELFYRMLTKTERNNVVGAAPSENTATSDQIGRLMYEKNYIAALTSAIAELDLNFPNAKRAVKYILNPLKSLTELGVKLSQSSDFSSSVPGTSTEEDDISSATSVSDEDAEREHTPDLLRNTTLGMLESGADQDEESSGSDDEDGEEDEDMYDYEDEIEFEDEMAEHGDVVSDEDEDDDPEGMGEVEGMPGDVDMDVEIVMDPEDEDDEDDDDDLDDDEDEDDDGEDMDGEDFGEHMDEITGDDENGSLADGEEVGDWEDEADDEAFEEAGSPHGGPLLAGPADLVDIEDDEGDEPRNLIRVDMGDGPEDYFEDEMGPDDEMEDEEDDEGDYENDVVYEPELEEDDEDDIGMGGAWTMQLDAPPPPAIIRGHHHHHHPRNFGDFIGMMGGDGLGRAQTFRSHPRGGPGGRGDDDGTNPLLQREGVANTNNRERGDMNEMMSRLGRRVFAGMPRADFIDNIVATVGGGGNGTFNVTLGGIGGGDGVVARLPSMFRIGDRPGHGIVDAVPWREMSIGRNPELGWRGSDVTGEEAQAVVFRLQPTMARWQEEARMLFGGRHMEKAQRVINSIARVLVPPAMKAKLENDKIQAQRREAEEKAREEQRKKEDAEKAEREAREKQEREEREAKEREERDAREREEVARREQEQEQAGETEQSNEMEGVEENAGQAVVEAPAAATQTGERMMTTIRGREVDITSLGIDREFLDAMPEELREEVILGQMQEQRSQAAQTNEQPTGINREFLDALPPEIQQELMRQEAQERRHRERQEARRQRQQEAGQAAQPEDISNEDFFAMLDPVMRQRILAEADEGTIAALPEALQAEARALAGDDQRRAAAAAAPGGVPARDRRIAIDENGIRVVGSNRHGHDQAAQDAASKQRRPVTQMLDKSGVATLLRLMFVSLHSKAKTNLHHILSDVCKNTQNRAEVISILLSILQDGTADVGAVERSFAQLSLRAKQPAASKTSQPLKRSLTGNLGGSAHAPTTELSPLNIVSHCLSTLNALANDNQKVPSFFLTEHEVGGQPKIKKGKGRETKAAKYPLNALLALLDRKLITDNTGVMEILAALLSRVTHPLTILLRRAQETQESNKPAEADSTKTGDDVAMDEGSTATAEASVEATNGSTAMPAEDKSAEINEQPPKLVEKKRRELTPPEVPEENIRLVVNILAARECPSKTFSDTLDIIKNLSAIPGAKQVFGKELVRQAQELGQTVLTDLQDLAKQIESAQDSTDLQGLALANFSNSGSKQRKLLRVLLALDHLFDPKRMGQIASAGEPELKDNVLALLYESNTFEQLWSNLTICLAAIRKRGNMVNVATILLPLIESLMVVCRNSSLKEAAGSATVTTPMTESTPPPASRMEGLFFKFTEDNRQILNELIRNNPKLMSGNLSILARNSKVLEFDNKRTYFSRKLHNRGEARVPHGSLSLSVRRDHVFLDSFKSLYYKSPEEIKYGKLNIRFHGEEGVDAGGVSREWFAAMARQMFNPDYALFNPVAADRTTFHPNPLSEVNGEHLLFFKFIGRIIGKALYENRVLDCHFSRAVYRQILGRGTSLKDMESLDLAAYKALSWALDNDVTDVLFENFCYTYDRFGVTEVIDLVPNGRNIPLTEENKREYVEKMVELRNVKLVEAQLNKFLDGFHEIIPQELVSIFNEQELELLISGLPEIDVNDWKANTEYHNYQPTSPQIQWFWRAVASFDKEERAKLLQFVTGTSKVPLNGFKELEGMNGFAKFNIHRDYSSNKKLPSSHTCFNQLDLPEYENYEQLKERLLTAITAGGEYFGFA